MMLGGKTGEKLLRKENLFIFKGFVHLLENVREHEWGPRGAKGEGEAAPR